MRIQNEAKPNKITYLDGRPPKDNKLDSFIYLDIQIMELYSCLGAEEAIKYLKDKIELIKTMEGESKWVIIC